MSNINETIEEVEKLNPELARQIRHFVKNHTYGLVFEHNLPEAVRLYNKTPVVKDIVNILPARGTAEKEENKIPWVVNSINDGKALLEHCEEQKEVPLEDIVTVVSYKDTIYPGLKEIDRVERGAKDEPYHMVINAENYHALEALTYCYAGKVDCIYIDPPYNSGATDWKYNNDYVGVDDQYRHSKWLAFMERRLKLAKQLLNPSDSVLIVTIDEKEYARLGILLEQIFPEADIQMVSSVINRAGTGRKYEFSRTDEYIYFLRFGNATIASDKTDSSDKPVAWDTLRRSGPTNTWRKTKRQFYPIFVNDATKKIYGIGKPLIYGQDKIEDVVVPVGCTAVFPIRDNGLEMMWGCVGDEFLARLNQGYIKVGKYMPDKPQKYVISYLTGGIISDISCGKAVVRKILDDGSVDAYYIEDRDIPPTTNWQKPTHDAQWYGSNLINPIFGSRFSYPKSIYAVKDCIDYCVRNKHSALIIDFFAGSGTTLHAVNLLNAEDGGRRRCICVTNNEVSEDEEKKFIKAGLRPYDDEWKKYGIAHYVTWPRTKCTIEGHDINGNPLTGNYGCDKEIYEEIEADIIDPETNKKIRGKVYKKSKKPTYPLLAQINKSDGFKANAIFCELTYESAWPIRLDRAFNAIAPMLWMQAGCRGEIINKIGKSFSTTDYYGVLFDYNQASKFCEKVQATPSIKHVYIVTDDQRRYSNLCRRLPGVEVHRLYETYLKTFEICGEGGLD